MALFDDLIPGVELPSKAPQVKAGRFEDLVPKPKEEAPYDPAFDPKLLTDETLGIKKTDAAPQEPLGDRIVEGVKTFINPARALPDNLKPPEWIEESLKQSGKDLLLHPVKTISEAGARYPKAIMRNLEQAQLGFPGEEPDRLFPGGPMSPKLFNPLKDVFAPKLLEDGKTPDTIAWDMADRIYGKVPSQSVAWNFLKYLPFTAASRLTEFHTDPALVLQFKAINGVLSNPSVAKHLARSFPAPQWVDNIIKGTIQGFYRPFATLAENMKENRVEAITDEILKKFEPRMEEVRSNYKNVYGVEPTENDLRGLIKAQLVEKGMYNKPLMELQAALMRAKRLAPFEPAPAPEPPPATKPPAAVQPAAQPLPPPQQPPQGPLPAGAEVPPVVPPVKAVEIKPNVKVDLEQYPTVYYEDREYKLVNKYKDKAYLWPTSKEMYRDESGIERPSIDDKNSLGGLYVNASSITSERPENVKPHRESKPAVDEEGEEEVAGEEPASVEGKAAYKDISSMTKEEMINELNALDEKNKTEIARLDKIDPNRQRLGTIELSADEIQRMNELGNAIDRIKLQEAAPAIEKINKRKEAARAKSKEDPFIPDYWRVGGMDGRVGKSLGYNDKGEVVLEFSGGKKETFLPHELFPAKQSEASAAQEEVKARPSGKFTWEDIGKIQNMDEKGMTERLNDFIETRDALLKIKNRTGREKSLLENIQDKLEQYRKFVGPVPSSSASKPKARVTDPQKALISSAPKKHKLPVLENVRVSDGYGYTTDLDTALKVKIDKPNGLYKVVGSNLEPSEHDPQDFPVVKPLANKIGSFNKEEMTRNLVRAARQVSSDDTREVLKGALLDIKGGKASLVGTDGRRLSLSNVEVQGGVDGKYIISNPAKVARMLTAISGESLEARVNKEQNRIEFSGENGSVYSMMIEGNFPEYEQVLEVPAEHSISIQRGELVKALRELKPYAKDFAKSYGGGMTPQVIIEPRGKDVYVYATGPEGKKKEFVFKGAATLSPQKIKGQGTIVLPMGNMNNAKLHTYNFDYFSDAVDNVTGDKVIIGLPKEPKVTHISGEAKVDNAKSKGYTVKEGESNYYADKIQAGPGKNDSAGKQNKRILQQSPLYTKFKKVGGLVFASEEISSPADVAFAFKQLKNEAVEHFYCVGVKGYTPICVELISIGSINASVVDPLETVRLLLNKKADGVYFVHNHPSGDINPSNEDISITGRLKKTLGSLGIKALGHVIIDDTKFSFINESGSFEEFQHKETAEQGKKVSLYKKYVEWVGSVEKTVAGEVITGPGSIFEIIKGLTLDFEKSDAVIYTDNRLRVLSIEAIPRYSDHFKNIIKTATNIRSTRVCIATGNEHIWSKTIERDFTLANIDLLDVIKINSDGTYTSHRSEGEIEGDTRIDIAEEKGEYSKKNFATPQEGLEAWVKKQYADQDLKLNGIEMPELVRLAVKLSGNTPVVKKLITALGYFQPATAKIALEQKIFKYPKVAAQVLAHEIGHLVDWLPDKTMARGNILGRIASLRHYLKGLLAEMPGLEKTVLTDEDKDRIRKEARNILKEEQKLGERDIIEEVIREIPIYEKVNITADEILSVWRGAATEIRETNPALYDFLSRLSTAQKKAIIQQALKGIIDPRIVDLSGEGKRVGTRIEKEQVKKHVVPPEPTPENIAKKFKELLAEEIKKRKLFEENEIREELKRATQWWNPFDDTKSLSYTRYRYSSEELYAEAVSMLLNRPDKLKEIAPSFYKAFFNYLERKPELKDLLLGLQDTLAMGEEGKLAERHKDVLDMFQRGEDQFFGLREKYKLLRKDPWFLMKYSFLDRNIALYEKVDQAKKAGQRVNPEDDPRYFLEEYNYLGGKLKSLMEDVREKVMVQLEKSDLTIEDFGQYLFFYRVANERAEIANPLGHNPETARAQLDFLKNTLGAEKFSVLEKAQQDFRSVMLDLLKEAVKSGILPESKFVDLAKNPAYATFQVLDYLEDYVTPTIIKQVGTLKPIANPFASTLLKMISTKRAIERNDTNKAVLRFMKEHFPAEIENAPVRRFGKYRVDVPAKEGMGTIKARVNGKLVAYYVDPYIANTCNYSPVAVSNGIVDILRIANSGWFRPVYVNFNVGFQAFNFIRDFTRAWKLNPDVSFVGHMKSYLKAAPHAFNRIWGDKGDQVIREMEENGMFSFTYNEIMRGANDEDEKMVEYLMRKYQVTDRQEAPKGMAKVPHLLKQVGGLIEDMGNFIESLPKIAGYMDRQVKGMDIKQIAHEVRTYTGSPDFLRRGAAYNDYNNVLLFSNAIKEGLRGDYEGAFKDPRTRAGYWWKTAARDIIPKILQMLAVAGFFGKKIKDAYDRMTEYDKTNYLVIPLGMTEDDKVVYARLPSDESGRLIGAIFWKVLNFNRVDPVASTQEILSYAGGQIPSFSPAIELPANWLQYMFGKVPYDYFKGKPIVNEDEMRAGGKYAAGPMIKWTLGELGAYSFTIKADAGEKPVEKAVRLAPVVNRFIRITDYGLKEKQRYDDSQYWKDKARRRLDVREEKRR